MTDLQIGSPVGAQEPPQWQSIETAPKDKTLVIVALIRDGVLWRVSDAAFNGLGWYTKSGDACHWRTHWMPLPLAPLAREGPPDEAGHEEKDKILTRGESQPHE